MPTTVGLLAGILMVAWIRPTSSPGAILLVVMAVMVANMAGALVRLISGRS